MITCIALSTLNALAICIALLVVNSIRNLDSVTGGAAALGKTASSTAGIAAIVVMCYSAIFSWFTIGLFGFHMFLVYRGMSTNEYIKGHLDKFNPYSKGGLGNFMQLFALPHRAVKPAILPPLRDLPIAGQTGLTAEDIQLSN